jgi:hypothetical protein
MNIFLGILQVLLALHTMMGAFWKFSQNAGQTMPSLKAIPDDVWMGMGVIEILCAIALVLPLFNKKFGILAPIAALIITLTMILMTGVHFASGDSTYSSVAYWLVVASLCGFVAFARLVLKPVKV